MQLFSNIMKHMRNPTPKSEVMHTCGNCKYRHSVHDYDPYYGTDYCVRSFCDKDNSLMDSWHDTSRYIYPCEYFKYGNGTSERVEDKER